MLKDIAGIAKTETQNRKAIYRLLQMDKVPDKGKVLLAFLGHPRFTNMFKKDHPNTEVFVLENQELNWLYDEIENVTLVNPVNINEIKEALKDMKFDYIIMNPPYNGNLHLKILEEAMKHSDSVVNLSPVRWLQDPLSEEKSHSDFLKFENTISKHIISLDIITGKDAWKLFNAGTGDDLGVYFIQKDKNSEIYKNIKWNKINKYFFDKFKKDNFPKLEQYTPETSRAFVAVKSGANNERTTRYNIVAKNTYKWIYNKKLPDGTDWETARYKSKSFSNEKYPMGLYFNTEKEAKNFYSSCLTSIYKFIVSTFKIGFATPLKCLPYMGNEINPRTGLKGYESEWTDEDFYKFFNLSSDEIKIIEETMAKYK